MPLKLSLMEEEDIPTFAAIDAAAMADWGMAQAMDSAATGGEPRQAMVERWTREGFRNDSRQVYLKITDDETDEIVAVGMWRFQFKGEEQPKDDVPAPAVEVEGEVEKKKEQGAQEKVEAGPDVMVAMTKIGKEFRKEFVGAKPHANLSLVVTHPKHRRRGAANMLVQWGCEKADERGLMCCLMASQMGLAVYLKHRFVVVKETPLDLRPYGVDETEIRRGMIRKSKAMAEES